MPLAWIENTASGQSHTLGAFDYRLEGDDLYILCYDCNLAGTVKEIQVKDYQDADSASWSFVTLGWGGSQADAGLWADKNYFTYYAPDMGDDIFFYTEKARTDVLASVSSEEDLEQIQTTGTLQVTPISYLSSAEEADAPLLADANPFDGVKAWISGDGTLLLERLSPDGEITLADNTAAYHADAAASYAAALQNGAVDQVSAGGGALTLTCEYYAESGDNIAVTFTGAPDREGGSVTMKRENGAVVFQNAGADSSVTVVYQDTDGGAPDRTWTQTVSDGDTIRIEADGESAPVIKADGDDSGSDGGGDDTGDSGSGGGSSSGNQTTVEDSEGGTISVSKKNPSKGETVTITTDPEDGYEVDSILVTDRNGNPIAVTDNGDGTYSFVQPSGAVTIQPVFRPISAPVFDDVPSGAWYYGAVQWAVENGITSGTSSSTFSPDRPCTRGEVVTLLWRAMGEPEADASSCPFTDVQTGDYCYDAVLWAAESGITTGTSATSFSPGLVCTRAQVTALLWRAMGEPETQTDGNPFADVQAGDYYCKAVLWAVENGVTTGTSSAAFSPDTACTRAQAVTFLYRNFTK